MSKSTKLSKVKKNTTFKPYPLNQNTATVKLISKKSWKFITHNPKYATSMLDIFVIEEGEGYEVWYFDWNEDKWKKAYCESFDEIIAKYGWDKERG